MVIFHSYVSLPEGSIIPYHQQGFSITAQLASCRYALLSNGKMDHLTAQLANVGTCPMFHLKRRDDDSTSLIPSGYLTVCHGKLLFLMGKSTINVHFL